MTQNTITQHVWTSRLPDLNAPDLCVFDLDPPGDDPAAVRATALGLRDLLAELGLTSWVKTTGSKGFHIVVPLDGTATMGAVARFANAVGTLFTASAPERLTQEFSKAEQGDVAPATFTVRNMPARMAAVGDLWKGVHRRGRSLAKPMERLGRRSRG